MDAMKKALANKKQKTIDIKIIVGPSDDASEGLIGSEKEQEDGLAPEVLDTDAAAEGEAPSADPMEEHKEMMGVMDGVQDTVPGKTPGLNQRAKMHIAKMMKEKK